MLKLKKVIEYTAAGSYEQSSSKLSIQIARCQSLHYLSGVLKRKLDNKDYIPVKGCCRINRIRQLIIGYTSQFRHLGGQYLVNEAKAIEVVPGALCL